MPNPTQGSMEFGLALVGLLLGGVTTIVTDRYFGATHALVASTPAGTTATSFADTPAQGQVYNAVGPATPIWSNWQRIVSAIANVIVPFGLSAWLGKGRPGVKSLFQLWGFSSLTVTTVKVGTDGAAMFLGKQTWLNGLGPRLFAPEIDATNALTTTKAMTAALPSYTLVAGGTGPAPAGQAAGNTTLGATTSTRYNPPYASNSQCPPGYAANSDGRCVPMPPENQPPVMQPPPVTQPPAPLPPENQPPPVFTQPPANPPTQSPPYFTPPPAPPADGVYDPGAGCGFEDCAGAPAFACAPDKNDF
jgi:hypothetical protein